MVSNMFYFHPYLGKWSNLTNSFHMGWNHQLDMDGYGVSSLTRPFSACLPTIHFSEAMLALGCVPPQNLTTRYPKWRHIWSPRYIFQPAYHFLGIYPLNFLGVAIHMCSWCFLTGLCCHKDGWTKPGYGFLPRMMMMMIMMVLMMMTMTMTIRIP